jgi:hypothetical protein
MSRMMRAAAPVLLAACASESRSAIQAGDTAREEVIEAVESYYADFSAREWDRFSGHFWPSATLTTVWQPPGENAPRVVTTTVPEFVRLAPQGPDSKPIFEERMDSSDVRVAGNLAHVWAHYTARFGDSTDVATWRGIDAFTLMKHDGRWRIVALAYTDAP